MQTCRKAAACRAQASEATLNQRCWFVALCLRWQRRERKKKKTGHAALRNEKALSSPSSVLMNSLLHANTSVFKFAHWNRGEADQSPTDVQMSCADLYSFIHSFVHLCSTFLPSAPATTRRNHHAIYHLFLGIILNAAKKKSVLGMSLKILLNSKVFSLLGWLESQKSDSECAT